MLSLAGINAILACCSASHTSVVRLGRHRGGGMRARSGRNEGTSAPASGASVPRKGCGASLDVEVRESRHRRSVSAVLGEGDASHEEGARGCDGVPAGEPPTRLPNL